MYIYSTRRVLWEEFRLGGSTAVEITTTGAASAIAIPAASGSFALIADGAAKIGISVALFKKSKDYDLRLNKQHKGTPKTNTAQNRQAADARKQIEKKIGRKLTKKEIRNLHDAIHGQDFGYWEIVQEGIELFKK